MSSSTAAVSHPQESHPHPLVPPVHAEVAATTPKPMEPDAPLAPVITTTDPVHPGSAADPVDPIAAEAAKIHPGREHGPVHPDHVKMLSDHAVHSKAAPVILMPGVKAAAEKNLAGDLAKHLHALEHGDDLLKDLRVELMNDGHGGIRVTFMRTPADPAKAQGENQTLPSLVDNDEVLKHNVMQSLHGHAGFTGAHNDAGIRVEKNNGDGSVTLHVPLVHNVSYAEFIQELAKERPEPQADVTSPVAMDHIAPVAVQQSPIQAESMAPLIAAEAPHAPGQPAPIAALHSVLQSGPSSMIATPSLYMGLASSHRPLGLAG